jgi:hypothetical protein
MFNFILDVPFSVLAQVFPSLYLLILQWLPSICSLSAVQIFYFLFDFSYLGIVGFFFFFSLDLCLAKCGMCKFVFVWFFLLKDLCVCWFLIYA